MYINRVVVIITTSISHVLCPMPCVSHNLAFSFPGQKLTAEISMTFQNLLSSLASSNTKAKQVILEKGGAEIAV